MMRRKIRMIKPSMTVCKKCGMEVYDKEEHKKICKVIGKPR